MSLPALVCGLADAAGCSDGEHQPLAERDAGPGQQRVQERAEGALGLADDLRKRGIKAVIPVKEDQKNTVAAGAARAAGRLRRRTLQGAQHRRALLRQAQAGRHRLPAPRIRRPDSPPRDPRRAPPTRCRQPTSSRSSGSAALRSSPGHGQAQVHDLPRLQPRSARSAPLNRRHKGCRNRADRAATRGSWRGR